MLVFGIPQSRNLVTDRLHGVAAGSFVYLVCRKVLVQALHAIILLGMDIAGIYVCVARGFAVGSTGGLQGGPTRVGKAVFRCTETDANDILCSEIREILGPFCAYSAGYTGCAFGTCCIISSIGDIGNGTGGFSLRYSLW